MSEYATANCAKAYPATMNWLILTTPKPNCATVMMPLANWPMATTPLAGTGSRFGRYLKEMCSNGRPRIFALDLYSNPQPSHFSLAGNGAPQLGQAIACSEIWSWHSLQGFIICSLPGRLFPAHDVPSGDG